MDQIIEVLKNRRVWAGIVGMTAFILGVMGSAINIDIPVLTNLLATFGGSLASLITASLALWSFISPKK